MTEFALRSYHTIISRRILSDFDLSDRIGHESEKGLDKKSKQQKKEKNKRKNDAGKEVHT